MSQGPNGTRTVALGRGPNLTSLAEQCAPRPSLHHCEQRPLRYLASQSKVSVSLLECRLVGTARPAESIFQQSGFHRCFLLRRLPETFKADPCHALTALLLLPCMADDVITEEEEVMYAVTELMTRFV